MARLDPDEELGLIGGGAAEEDDESMVLNLADVDESLPKYEALPAGTYDAQVQDVVYERSKNNNPMLTWVLRVTTPEYEGRLLFTHFVLNSEAGKSRLKRALLAVCPDVDMTTFNPKKFADEGVALERPCRVKVRVRPYQGERRNQVTEILPPADGGGTGFLD